MGGKRRIPMARIADLQARRVCFAKRRQGLFRKCLQLCHFLPGYQVAAVAFSPDVGTPFAFAAPSSSASPAHLFRVFLSSGFDPRGAPAAAGGLGVGGPAGRTVEDDGSHHHCVSGLPSSSPSLDDEFESTQTLLMSDAERAELAAALRWADGVLAFGDGPGGSGPSGFSTEEEDLAAGSVFVWDDAAALAVTALPPPQRGSF